MPEHVIKENVVSPLVTNIKDFFGVKSELYFLKTTCQISNFFKPTKFDWLHDIIYENIKNFY